MSDTFTAAGPKPGVTLCGTEWTPELLREVRDSVEEQDMIPVKDSTSFQPRTLGRVTDARYDEGNGLVFEFEVDDPEIANQIEDNMVDVAPIVIGDKVEDSDELSNPEFDSVGVYKHIEEDCYGTLDSEHTGVIDDYDSFIENG